MSQDNQSNRRTILTATEARQGETHGHVRVILAVSMLLALLAGVGFLIYFGA